MGPTAAAPAFCLRQRAPSLLFSFVLARFQTDILYFIDVEWITYDGSHTPKVSPSLPLSYFETLFCGQIAPSKSSPTSTAPPMGSEASPTPRPTPKLPGLPREDAYSYVNPDLTVSRGTGTLSP